MYASHASRKMKLPKSKRCRLKRTGARRGRPRALLIKPPKLFLAKHEDPSEHLRASRAQRSAALARASMLTHPECAFAVTLALWPLWPLGSAHLCVGSHNGCPRTGMHRPGGSAYQLGNPVRMQLGICEGKRASP